jgi:hypothetical protein
MVSLQTVGALKHDRKCGDRRRWHDARIFSTAAQGGDGEGAAMAARHRRVQANGGHGIGKKRWEYGGSG